MKLIAGLGNPDKKYSKTRHNLGYMVLDYFARENGLSWKYSQDWMCYFIKTRRYILIKPTTYMNKSGESVLSVSNYFKIDPDDVLIVYDDVDLPFGKMRLAVNGVSAGHHGLDSMIESLSTVDFGRLRVGIDRPNSKEAKGKNLETADYVLEEFSHDQKKELPEVLLRSVDALNSYLDDGIEATMNRFN